MATVISIEDFMTSKHEHSAIFDATMTGEKLRATAARLAEVLAWHVQNTPLSAWQAALGEGGIEWPGGLLHALYRHRPKRQATPAETAEIARLLKAMMGRAPDDLLRRLSTDPDWHLFELPKPTPAPVEEEI